MTASAILSDIQMSSRLVLSTTYPQGFKAVRPAICPESRLSREPGAPLYSVQLGTRKTKPQLLYPLVLSEVQRAAPRLQAVCGQENGPALLFDRPLVICQRLATALAPWGGVGWGVAWKNCVYCLNFLDTTPKAKAETCFEEAVFRGTDPMNWTRIRQRSNVSKKPEHTRSLTDICI